MLYLCSCTARNLVSLKLCPTSLNVVEVQQCIQQFASALETPVWPYPPHSSRKKLAKKTPARLPQKIKLQRATAFKARAHFKQQNVTSQLRKELQNPATATVDNSQRMQPKARHRQLESLAKVHTHSKLHLKLLSVFLYGTRKEPDLP